MTDSMRDASSGDLRSLARPSLQGACAIMLLLASDVREPARPARVSAPQESVHEQDATKPASGERPSAATVSLIPNLQHDLGQHLWAIEEVGERKRMIAGSLRCEVTSDQVILADDRFGFPILGAARVGQGWLFVAADGAVARADSFLGPLQPLGQVPQPYWAGASLQVSDGRLAFPTQDPRASLWTTDGSAPIAPARGAPPGVVQSAAFVDAGHGMIVVDGGQLFVTRDGAASFERVDLGEEGAAAVTADRGALRVATSSGIMVFDRDGKLTAHGILGPTPGATQLYETDHASLFRRLFVAVVRRYGALVAESLGWVVAPDGRVLVPIVHGRPPLPENVLGPLSEVTPAEIAEYQHMRRCRAARWGKDYAVSCTDGGLFRVDATTLRGTLAIAEFRDSEASLFQDGVRAAWVCDVGRSMAQLCMASDRGTLRRPIRPPAGQRVIGSHGDEVVMSPTEGNALVLVHASTGSERSLSVRLPPDVAPLTGHDWQLSANGAIAFVVAGDTRAAAGGDRWVVRVGLSDGTMTTVPLPDGATRAGFVNGDLGVAVDEEAHRVWVTYEGGSRWHEHAGFSGRARLGRPLRRPDPAFPLILPVKCGGNRCVIDGEIVVSFDGSSSVARDRVLASPAGPPGVPRTVSAGLPGVPPADAAGLACATRDIAWPARVHGGVRDNAFETDGRVQFQKPNVDGTLRVTAAGRWEVTWRGTDSLGRYGPRHAAGDVFAPRSARAGGDDDEYELRSASREGVVISDSDYQRATFRLIWMPAGGRAQVIVSERVGIAELEDTVALPDGRLAVLIRLSEPGNPRSFEGVYHRLVLVERTRGVIARRTYYWDYRSAGIGFFDGTVGVQWGESDLTSPHWFLPISADTAIPGPAKVDLASTPVCSTRSRTGVVAITVEDFWPFEGRGREYPVVRVYLRNEGRPCIQSVEFREPRLTGRDVFLAASSGGELSTRLDLRDVDTRLELRCGIEPVPDWYVSALGHADVQYAWSEYHESAEWQQYRREQEQQRSGRSGSR